MQNPESPSSRANITTISIILFAAGCLVLACLAVGALFLVQSIQQASNNEPTAEISATSLPVASPTPGPSPTAGPSPTPAPLPADTLETQKILESAPVPEVDAIDVAARLKNIQNVPETIQAPPRVYQVGEKEQFWVVNSNTDVPFQMTAVLAYATPHLYLFVDQSVSFNPANAKALGDTFENKIYPTDRAFFGSEWSPGVDGDVHLFVVVANNIGTRAAGYFSSGDEVNPLADPKSNGHEMFVLNAQSFPGLAGSYVYSVLAHEFQHMIHWNIDRNEEGWMNEGFSELAAFLNGYDIGGFDTLFARKPDLQLNDWPNDKNSTAPHYGASFLFLDYLLNRYGKATTQAVVANPLHGLDSIDQVLMQTGAKDPTTNLPVTADDLFTDWTLTNYIKDSAVGDGRFTYANYSAAPRVPDSETVSKCPTGDQARKVSQYGTDYIRITCRGNYILNFQGARQVQVVPATPHSGVSYFWSNKGDDSDMTLTHSFDLTGVSGNVSMSYWTWYDLETNYDYVYVEASTDGQSWSILPSTSGTSKNLGGENLGIGYNAVSKTWLRETVDLSQFAGKSVQVRFEYLTDAAVNGEGFLIDDISIPQLAYSTDFEKDDGGWVGKGFVRIEDELPQTFRVSLIHLGQLKSVQYLTLSEAETLSLPIALDSDTVLVVSGTTRHTRQAASYTFSIR